MIIIKIGLIDVDNNGHEKNCFPNIPLMKLSAFHKRQGDHVEWYHPLEGKHFNRVYLSKIFGFIPDYPWPVDADEIIRGGSGYAISLQDGKEAFQKGADAHLPSDIEHTFPDYSLYGVEDTAFGFLTRGCPRGCPFCHVSAKEGQKSVSVADLNEFWSGQRNIKLLDPNLLACKDHMAKLRQLAQSGAWVDFTQGLDIRLMTRENTVLLNQIKVKRLHFAWDDPHEAMESLFERFMAQSAVKSRSRLIVYVLTNFHSTLAEDLHRIYTLRDLGYSPYVMVYDKQNASVEAKRLQRYVNCNMIFRSVKRFEDYDPKRRSTKIR